MGGITGLEPVHRMKRFPLMAVPSTSTVPRSTNRGEPNRTLIPRSSKTSAGWWLSISLTTSRTWDITLSVLGANPSGSSIPYSLARAKDLATEADLRSALDGTHPKRVHSPPSLSFSIMHVFVSMALATLDENSPPAPPPMTTRSNSRLSISYYREHMFFKVLVVAATR